MESGDVCSLTVCCVVFVFEVPRPRSTDTLGRCRGRAEEGDSETSAYVRRGDKERNTYIHDVQALGGFRSPRARVGGISQEYVHSSY